MNDDNEILLTTEEVARLFRVTMKTVTRWADDGKLSYMSTPGGHRRYFKSDIAALLSTPTKETTQ